MDKRPVCGKCMHRMNSIKNGETIVYSQIAYQDGDRYQCPICKTEVIIEFGEPYTKEDQISEDSNRRKDKDSSDKNWTKD